MKRALTILMCVVTATLSATAENKTYTPKPGTPVRKAICDAMRKYMRQTHEVNPKLKFLWKIDTMKVQGNYVCFEGHAVKSDGSFFDDDSMIGDFVQMTFLRRNKDGWWVIADLTRSDVPAAEELREI